MNSRSEFEERCRRVRALTIAMAHRAREGHLNGALSCVEILVSVFDSFLKPSFRAGSPIDGDRFIFSKGHACASLYAVLADYGLIDKSLLTSYARNNSALPSHPCVHMLPQLDWSSGSLGHGLGIATGMAYARRLRGSSSRVVALLSDGECNEGSTWEAAMFACAQRLSSVIAIVDANGIQSIDRTKLLVGDTSFRDKFRAFGWNVVEVEGHKVESLLQALETSARSTEAPTAIIAHTTAGKGVSFMENQVLWHYRSPSDEDLQAGLLELGFSCSPLEER